MQFGRNVEEFFLGLFDLLWGGEYETATVPPKRRSSIPPPVTRRHVNKGEIPTLTSTFTG